MVRKLSTINACIAVVTGLCISAVVSVNARAQQYPSRPISIITSVGPGSNFDQLARVFIERLRQKLGVPVVLENVTGGQGIIAAQRVLNAKSDGYTLLIGGTGVASTPAVMKNAGYKSEDFVALAPLGQVPFILFVTNAVPANDIPSLMSYLKANVKTVNSAVLTTSHVSMMLSRKFGKLAGGNLTEVGYRSSPEMAMAMLANDVHMMATTFAIGGQHVASGKFKAIGVAANERTQSLPDLPTFKEKGYPTLIINIWEVLYAKADVPPEVLDKIRSVSKEILNDPSFIKAMGPTGMEPWNVPVDKVQSVIDDEVKAFKKDAEELNIKFN
jgi:tripartite-type tricarboxylate transporter receptor subunit TctC